MVKGIRAMGHGVGIETQVPVPLVVRDQQMQARSQMKALTSNHSTLGGRNGWEGARRKCERGKKKRGSWWGKRGV